MKYLVTGGYGFIGSNYILKLLAEEPEATVVNLDCLTYAGRVENLKSVQNSPRYKFYYIDINAGSMVDQVYQTEKPDIVINFAAESHVDRSIQDASLFIRTNVLGTFNMLEAARKHGVQRFIQIGTDEVYGQIPEPLSSKEVDPLDPRSPYSSSKASADLLALAYFTTHKVPVTVTRCCNNYGPQHLPEKLIPLFITNLVEGKQVPVYGDGLQVREWIHVFDHNDAINFVIKNGQPGQIYNIGSGHEKTNLFITNFLLKSLGKDELSIKYVEDRKGHDRRYSIDCSKLRALGWTPKKEFEAALEETIQWYLKNEWWWKPIKKELQEYYKGQYK